MSCTVGRARLCSGGCPQLCPSENQTKLSAQKFAMFLWKQRYGFPGKCRLGCRYIQRFYGGSCTVFVAHMEAHQWMSRNIESWCCSSQVFSTVSRRFLGEWLVLLAIFFQLDVAFCGCLPEVCHGAGSLANDGCHLVCWFCGADSLESMQSETRPHLWIDHRLESMEICHDLHFGSSRKPVALSVHLVQTLHPLFLDRAAILHRRAHSLRCIFCSWRGLGLHLIFSCICEVEQAHAASIASLAHTRTTKSHEPPLAA